MQAGHGTKIFLKGKSPDGYTLHHDKKRSLSS